MPRYRAVFERIGRTRAPQPLEREVPDFDVLAYEIDKYARKFLGSRDVDVAIFETHNGIGEPVSLHGFITAGVRVVGRFDVEVVQ